MSEDKRKGKESEFSPLSITMLKLPQYSGWFDISEIAFFECMIVKQKSFNGKQFYYSCRRLTEELHIKRIRLDTIIKRFAELGIIEVEIKGMPKQHHFRVDFKQIIALIPQIYQFAYFYKLNVETCELYAYFYKLYAQTCKQKEYNKEFNKESKKGTSEFEKEGSIIVDESTIDHSLFFNNKNSAISDKEKKAQETAEKKAQREAEQKERSKQIEIDRLKNLLDSVYAQRVEMYNDDVPS